MRHLTRGMVLVVAMLVLSGCLGGGSLSPDEVKLLSLPDTFAAALVALVQGDDSARNALNAIFADTVELNVCGEGTPNDDTCAREFDAEEFVGWFAGTAGAATLQQAQVWNKSKQHISGDLATVQFMLWNEYTNGSGGGFPMTFYAQRQGDSWRVFKVHAVLPE